MSNVTIGWDNTTPASDGLVGQGDDILRSLKSNVQGALDAEHHFPSAGGAAGAHRLGSARVFVGTSSQVSSADTSGRMMVTSDTSRLYNVSSGMSYPVGGRTYLEAQMYAQTTPRTLSTASRWQLSAMTTVAGGGVNPATFGGVSFPAGAVFNVTVDQVSYSTISIFPVIQATGLTGGLPVVYLYNYDGTLYAGPEVVLHCIAISTATF